MKALVTILVCRRVVMPYLFMRYALPRMREVFPGPFDALLIQHKAGVPRLTRRLVTTQLDKDREDLLDQWIAEGRYGDARIETHAEWHAPYPHIPSHRRAAEAALRGGYDFHLWLEDDALVLDPTCDRWDDQLGSAEVGVYRPRLHQINCSYFVTRPSFDSRVLPWLRRTWAWREFHRIEDWFRAKCAGEPAVLEQSYATKNHHQEYPYTGMRWLVDAVNRLCPEELDTLAIDFGDESRRAGEALRAGAPSPHEEFQRQRETSQ